MRSAIDAGNDPALVYLSLTAGLEIEVFQTILKKAYYVNGRGSPSFTLELNLSNSRIHS